MTDIPEVMTTTEAAKALRCSTATVLRRIRNGSLEGSADLGRVTKRSVVALLGLVAPMVSISNPDHQHDMLRRFMAPKGEGVAAEPEEADDAS